MTTQRVTLSSLAIFICVGQLLAQELKGVDAQRSIVTVPHRRLMEDRFDMGLDEDHDFLFARGNHENGIVHNRFHQVFRGIRVWGGEVITHDHVDGVELKKATRNVYRRINISSEPILNTSEAMALAHQDLAPQGPYSYEPAIELVIYPEEVQKTRPGKARKHHLNAEDVTYEVQRYHLAYHIHTMLENGVDPVSSMDYLVDAHTGNILKKWSTLMTESATATGYSQYNGTVTLTTNRNDSTYEMKDPTRNSNYVTDMNNRVAGDGTLYTDADNVWGDGQQYNQSNSTTSSNGQTGAVDAAYAQQVTWDLFKNVFGRSGIVGPDITTYIRIHYGNANVAAFYNKMCNCVSLGDSDGNYNDAYSIQTVAHELGHGFNDATSGLMYFGESGGLSEANADIIAAAAFFYAKRMGASGNTLPSSVAKDDKCWDLFYEEGPPLRYMTKPSKDGRSKDAWSSELGNLDVHFSSGPGNRMFFFLSVGASTDRTGDDYSLYTPSGFPGIGPHKAARIWFRAMTNYLTSTSNYLAARTACLNACSDLYGASGNEYAAVMNAFAAINVGKPAGIFVTTSPISILMASGRTRQFSATVEGSTNKAVTWTCEGGTISSSGAYTAPSTVGTYTVKATSKADTTKFAIVDVTVIDVDANTYLEDESNDSISDANALPNATTKIQGYLGTKTDTDYFKVDVDAGAVLTVNMTGPAMDYDLRLYDISGKWLRSSSGTSSTESISFQNKGTSPVSWFIQVKGQNDAYSIDLPYYLTLAVTKPL